MILAAMCAKIILIGFSTPPSLEEQSIITQAIARCPVLYPKSPCVRKIDKVGEQAFQVTCGQVEPK